MSNKKSIIQIIILIISITALITSIVALEKTYFNNGGGMGFAPSSGYSETIDGFVEATDATITVSSINDDDGYALDLSAENRGYFTIDPGQTDAERILCTGATGTTLTGCVRGLPADGTSEIASTTLAVEHDIGSIIIMSNIAQFYNNYLNVWDDQTATGTKTFLSLPKVPEDTPTDNSEVASWGVINLVALQGAATSSESTAGIGIVGTGQQIASSTQFDADNPHFVNTELGTSTPGIRAVGYFPVSKHSGYLDHSWFDLSEDFTFTGEVNLATSTMFGVQGGLMPAGSITAYATTTAPEGWLACDGSEISSTTFSALFDVIGYSYGGSPGGDFNLPNLNGRNIIGYGSATTTIDTMGETGGQDVHVLSIAELPAHTHTIAYNNNDGGSSSGTNLQSTSVSDNAAKTSSSVGSGTAHNVLDPFIVLRYIIKY